MKATAWSHVFTDGSRFSRNSLAEEGAYPTEREQPGLRGIPCSRLIHIPLCFLPVSIITSLFYHSLLFTFFFVFPVTPLQSQFSLLLVWYVATLYLASPWCRRFLHVVPAPCPLLRCHILTNTLVPFSCRHDDSCTSISGNTPGGILEIGWHEDVNSSTVNEVSWKIKISFKAVLRTSPRVSSPWSSNDDVIR